MCPKFSLDKPQYDLSTYYGRFRHFINITDPRTLLKSTNEVNEAKHILKNYKLTGLMCTSDADMWKYRQLVESAVHPSTGEIINPFFRVSAVAPINIPIVFGMIACPPSNVVGTLVLHLINQSYNTACNYSNRSTGDAQPFSQIATAYTLAVSSACTFAYGMGKLIPAGAAKSGVLRLLIPGVSTAAANVSNIMFTRMQEITDGAVVVDELGEVRGLSRIAGITSVSQTAATRCLLVPFAALLLPPLLMHGLSSVRLMPRSPAARMAVELMLICGSLQVAMPAALAVFPQLTEYKVSELEPEFRNLKAANGEPIRRMYCNKGL